LAVHHRVWKRHRIDKSVFSMMKSEQVIGLLGIFLIVIGYLVKASLIL